MAFPLAIPTHDAEPGTAVESQTGASNRDRRRRPTSPARLACDHDLRGERSRSLANVRVETGFCERIANAVLDSSKRHAVSPSLILAVMLNESDMNEKAFRTTLKAGKLYAKDGGLMGIRCIVDKHGHCVNGNVRGMAWSEVMDPVTNIDIGARELAHWRNGGGITDVTIRSRGSDGVLRTKQKHVPCMHKTHAYWAHYNHGPALHRSRTRAPLSPSHRRSVLRTCASHEHRHVRVHLDAVDNHRSWKAATHGRSAG